MTINELLAVCREINYLENHIDSLSIDDLEKITMQMRLNKLLNSEVGNKYCEE